MKIVSWNCRYGFTYEKVKVIEDFGADILVIQECKKTNFDQIKNNWDFKNWYNDDFYTDEGEKGSKLGIAIFSNEYKIEFTEIFNRKFIYVVPFIISNDNYSFILFSVWIKSINKNYFKPLYDAIEYYQVNKMLDDNSIIIGDFNIFTKTEDELRNIEGKLKPLINCTSLNTNFRLKPTYCHTKDNLGTDDFCFLGKCIAEKFKIDFNIPNEWDENQDKAHRWKGLSDHAPIIVTFETK